MAGTNQMTGFNCVIEKGPAMKSVSLGNYHGHHQAFDSRAGESTRESIFTRLFFVSREFIQSMKKQSDSFAAMGLAEGGDVEGAAQIMERTARK
jgi:hypothetical protein